MQLRKLLLATSLCAMSLPLHAQNWDGWHAGLQVGGARGDGDHDITVDGFQNMTNGLDFSLDEPTGPDKIEGGLIGIRVGRDWSRGALVFGVEAEASKTDISDFFANDLLFSGPGTNSNDFYETEIKGLGSVRGRIGYTVDAKQSTLLYGLIGLAAADVSAQNGDADFDDNDNLTIDCDQNGCAKASDTAMGYVVGAGVEHQLTTAKIGNGNLSIGFEYAYYDFGDVSFETETSVGGAQNHEFDVDLSTHTLQAVARVRF